MPENEEIFALWQMVSDQRDFNGSLRAEAVLAILNIYNATIEDFELLMAFERAYREEAQKNKEKDK